MLIHIQGGKGGKDRYIPLSSQVLPLLRAHWLTHRHPIWLFPARWSRQPDTVPMSEEGPRSAFRTALAECGIQKPAPSIPCATPGRPICWKLASICA